MTEEQTTSTLETPTGAVVAALVPVVAYLAAIAITDLSVEFRSVQLGGLVAAAPFYVLFVGLPSLFPIAVARTARWRILTTLIMTAVAVMAGVLVVSTDDAQAGLAVLWVPYVAVPLGLVLWIGRAISDRRRVESTKAGSLAALSDRLAALVIDIIIVGAALYAPLVALRDAKQEIAAGIIGVTAGAGYLGALTAARGQTLGQAIMRVKVVDVTASDRVPPVRAMLRSLVIVLEVMAAPTLVLAPPAIVELALASSGRSLTDRIFRTKVIAT